MALSRDIRDWLRTHIGLITREEKLKGSTSTSLYRISTPQADYVLRLFDNAAWLADEPDLCQHEASALKIASQANIRTPQLIAFEPDKHLAGVPLLLMEHLGGEIQLLPEDMDNYLRQSAETLAMIHAIPANDFPWTYFRYARPATLKVPSWSADPSKWQEIINVLRSPQPEAPIVFMHRDYHMTNFLWHDNILSGVVDWVNACTGYAGVDIGHMRVNLASVYGIDIAEQFLQAYQTANPAFDYHPYWDIVSIGDTILYDDNPPAVYPPWVEFGVTGLSDALMLERAEAYAQHILSLFRAL